MRSLTLATFLALTLATATARAEDPVGISDTRPLPPSSSSSSSSSEPPPPPITAEERQAARIRNMRGEMHTYFEGEANEGWVFGGAGVLSLGAGALALFAAKDDFYHGAAYPLAAVGVIQLAAGIVLGLRTHAQIKERDELLSLGDGRGFWELETKRMKRVQTEFFIVEVVEIGLAIAGIGLATYGGAKSEHTISGIGLGLAFQASAMLALDHAASQRADRYMNSILSFGP